MSAWMPPYRAALHAYDRVLVQRQAHLADCEACKRGVMRCLEWARLEQRETAAWEALDAVAPRRAP